jgi:hypothetical protein
MLSILEYIDEHRQNRPARCKRHEHEQNDWGVSLAGKLLETRQYLPGQSVRIVPLKRSNTNALLRRRAVTNEMVRIAQYIGLRARSHEHYRGTLPSWRPACSGPCAAKERGKGNGNL